MKRFLRETWELWYWAMFCPSRLQQRMNEWAPAEENDGLRSDTHSWEILLFQGNYRFIAQFGLLIFLLNLPLMWGIVLHGQALDLFLLLGSILTAYSIGIWCLPIGLHIPILLDLIYWVNPQGYLNLLYQIRSVFPPFFYVAHGLFLGILALIISTKIRAKGVVRSAVKKSIVIFVSCVVFVSSVAVVESIVAILVRTIATLPLPFFLLICWLIAASLSPTMQNWLAIITAVTLTALGFEHQGWVSFLAVPVTLMSYYRLADYLILTVIGFVLAILFVPFEDRNPVRLLHLLPFYTTELVWLPLPNRGRIEDRNPVRLLHLLPPYTTELVWLPLPNHDRILAAAFRTDASTTLATFQKMQASPLPGLKVTIKEALPQIITDQLTAIENISELIAIATPEHPFLPLLAPIFYQTQNLEIENQIIQMLSSFKDSLSRKIFIVALGKYLPKNWSFDIEYGTDIYKLLPRLQTLAKDVDAALKAGNIGIRKRALEPIHTYLLRLQLQLPELGLTTRALKRWKPVLVRWQGVIELELQEQQKQSQDELLNPFQYGNPLLSDRANLFRGRQTFADQIFRLILDRNRPTLVLHGPRRCGKTSFLYNLPRLLPSNLLPVYVDLQSSAITTDEAAFCQGLIRAIHRDSRCQGIELPIIPTRKEFLETPYIALEDWLEQAIPRLGERRLLLNLDEFEKIGTAIKEKRLSINLFDELRHLIQHYDSLAFLFSGVQTLDELGPNWSSYFISVVPLEMTYLEPDEAEGLLTDPDPEFALRYDRGIVEEIIQLTRCQPYLLQLLGSALVTQANLNHTQLVTPDLLQAAIPEAFTNGEPYFTNVWTEFTGNNPAEIIAGQEFLLDLANGLAPGYVQDLTDAAIRRLRRYHVIEQTDNGYVFEVPLLERWVRERAVISIPVVSE